ncbi:MAG: caspase family protein [Spirochaetales bacterium]|nr:caspase family protein [Spirochaetales bacterium]
MKRYVFLLFILIINPVFPAGVVFAQGNTTNPGLHDVQPEIVIQKGHNDEITSISYSPDKNLFATGSSDRTIRLWSKDMRLIRVFTGHSGLIRSLTFSRDGKSLLSGSADGTVRCWNSDGSKVNTIDTNSKEVFGAQFSADHQYIISGTIDNYFDIVIKKWSVDGRLIREKRLSGLGLPASEMKLHVLSDGSIVVFSPGRIDLIHPEQLEIVQTFTGGFLGVSKDGKYIFGTLEKDTKKLVGIWNTHNGTIKTTIDLPGKEPVCLLQNKEVNLIALQFKKDNHYYIEVRDFEKNVKKGEFELIGSSTWNILDFSPDGEMITVCTWEGIYTYSTRGDLLKIKKMEDYFPAKLTMQSNGDMIAQPCQDKNGVYMNLWSKKGKLNKKIPVNTRGFPYDINVSPDDRSLALGVTEGILLFDENGEYIKTLNTREPCKSFNFLDNNRILYTGKKLMKIIDIDGITSETKISPGSSVEDMEVSPPGSHVLIKDNTNSISLYDFSASGGVRLWQNQFFKYGFYNSSNSIVFTHDGKGFLTTGEDDVAGRKYSNKLKLFDLEMNLKMTFYAGNPLSIAAGADGGLYASGGDDNTIRVWNKTGELEKVYKGHSDWVMYLDFTKDGRFLVSGSKDTSIKLWNLQTDACTTFLEYGDQWIIYTQDGYFDCSPEGGRLVNITLGTESYGIDQFAVRNNRPDILLQRLGSKDEEIIQHYNKQYKKRLKRFGFSENQLSDELHIPEARIISKKVEGKNILLKFTVSDSTYKIKSYNVYINDVPLFGKYGKNRHEQSAVIEEKIELSSGENKIEVSCMNEKGAESYRVLEYETSTAVVKGNLYFISFGVSEYSNKELNLNYAHKDALDLARMFDGMKDEYNEVHIKTFLNSEVTSSNIKKAKDLLKNAGVDDTFVLFISGHGVHDSDAEATYYYLTHNTDVKNLKGTAANFELIENLMYGIAPRKKLFLIDTCESGEIEETIQNGYYAMADAKGIRARTTRKGVLAFQKNKRPYLNEKDRFIYNDLFRRSGAMVFSSCRGGEFSYETDQYENGLFTEEIINALATDRADVDKNGFVTIDELKSYVQRAVPELTNNMQHPTVDRDNIYMKFGFPVTMRNYQ